MEIRPKQATTKAPAERFTGDAWVDRIRTARNPRASASTSCASHRARGTGGMPTRSVRPCT